VPVTLDEPTTVPVTVQWTTISVGGLSLNEASPDADYAASSGTATFAPGSTSATATIPIAGDTMPEPDELIVISFHTPTNARLGGFWGLGFGGIADDD
jgi:hypothetical protein